MKKLILAMMVVAASCAFAKDQYDIRPDAAKGKVAPTAVEWQNKNDAAIAAATEESVLAALVADAASADALLAKIGTAYDGDPLVLTQIAAVTQWVMLPDPCFLCFWKPCPSDGRTVWVAALERKIAASQDGYVKTFCQQQLDLCK